MTRDLTPTEKELRRDEAQTQTPRPTCPRCRQAKVNCYCEALVPQSVRTRVIFLQHPAEARNPVGTARMAHLSIPGSRLFVGVDFSDEAALWEALSGAGRVGVLFPAPGAANLEDLAEDERPDVLLVIDGTWSQAKKIWKTNHRLQSLTPYRLTPQEPSRYRIRAEPALHCVSTIEATALALTALDGEDHSSMLRPFLAMVNRQVAHSISPSRKPRRKEIQRRHPPFVPPAIAAALSAETGILFVHALSDGRGLREAGETSRPKVVGARRLQTGETLILEAGKSPEDEIRERWAAFVQKGRGETWVTWTNLTEALLQAAGMDFSASETAFLKHWAAAVLHRSPGKLADGERLICPEQPDANPREALPSLTANDAQRMCEELSRMERIFQRLIESAKDGLRRNASFEPV